jgi:hypothetical protein
MGGCLKGWFHQVHSPFYFSLVFAPEMKKAAARSANLTPWRRGITV